MNNKKLRYALALVMICLIPNVFADTTLLDEQTTGGAPAWLYKTYHWASGFNITQDISPTDTVIIQLWNGTYTGAGQDDHLHVEIMTDNGGEPGTGLALNNSLTLETMSAPQNFSFTGFSTTAGMHWIAYTNPDQGPVDTFQMLYYNAAAKYGATTYRMAYNTSGSWVDHGTSEFRFRAWVIEGPAGSANETEGRTAIQDAIDASAASGATVYTDYTLTERDDSNNQDTGTFDKYVISGNQRWAFNYKTSGESYTGMFNLTPTLYVMGFEDMTASAIKSLVETTINNTKT